MKEYSIKELSELFHLPPSTLRYYEDLGILTNVERTTGGQRVYREMHVNRLRTICCFKKTGMTMSQLQTFFSYETDEAEHIDDILALLTEQKESVVERLAQLQNAYEHVLRKLSYYSDIKKAMDAGQPLPAWADYRNADFK